MQPPTTPPDMTPTLENLARELKNTGLQTEICNGFVACKFTPQKTKLQATIVSLCIRFGKRVVETNVTDKGFYAAFSL